MVARSAPDGLTLLMGNARPNALNQALRGHQLPYDSVRDLTPISMVSSMSMLVGVHPSFDPTNGKELIAMRGLIRWPPGPVRSHSGFATRPGLRRS